jgi:hypothetical protein
MSETVEYNGVKFRRYPKAKRRADRVYFTPGIADKKRGVKRLHEEIWMAHNGPIPDGCHIHHIDGDPLNNAVENLAAVTVREHSRHHAADRLAELQAHAAAIRPKSVAWHGSPEGRAWHSAHAERSILKAQPIEHTCEQCGKTFQTRPKRTNRFCSNNCKSQWRRLAGLDDEDRKCAACGQAFRVNRYSKKKCCDGKCAWALRRSAHNA